MISRVRRCASQRSSQAKTIRASRMFTIAKVNSTIATQGSATGLATPMPIAIPSSHRLATLVAGSSEP